MVGDNGLLGGVLGGNGGLLGGLTGDNGLVGGVLETVVGDNGLLGGVLGGNGGLLGGVLGGNGGLLGGLLGGGGLLSATTAVAPANAADAALAELEPIATAINSQADVHGDASNALSFTQHLIG